MQEHDQDQEQSQEDNELPDLYAELSREQPSEALDRKILAEAHKVVEPVAFGKKTRGPFSGQWTVPVSLAAVIVLSVSVVVLIERERPYSLTSEPEQPVRERMAEPATVQSESKLLSRAVVVAPAEKDVSKDDKVSAGKAESQIQSAARPAPAGNGLHEAVAPRPQAKLALVAPEPAAPPVNKQKADSDSLESREMKNEAALARADSERLRSLAEQETMALMQKKSATEVPQESGAAEKKQIAAANSATQDQARAATGAADISQHGPATSFDGQSMTRQAPAAVTENAESAAPEEQLAAETEDKIPDEQIAQAAPGSAPVKALEEKPATAARMAMPAKTDAPTGACVTLSIADCVSSAACVLQWQEDNNSYSCREPASDCEQNFVQLGSTAAACEATTGCKFVPAHCFCLPGTQCDCKDGPPAMCVPQSQND